MIASRAARDGRPSRKLKLARARKERLSPNIFATRETRTRRRWRRWWVEALGVRGEVARRHPKGCSFIESLARPPERARAREREREIERRSLDTRPASIVVDFLLLYYNCLVWSQASSLGSHSGQAAFLLNVVLPPFLPVPANCGGLGPAVDRSLFSSDLPSLSVSLEVRLAAVVCAACSL